MNMKTFTPDNYLETVTRDLLHQKEKILMEQLNVLLRDGVLLVEETQPVLVQSSDSANIELRQSVKLTYIGEKVIDALRKENERMKNQLVNIRNTLFEGYEE